MATLADMERALVAADAAGDMDAARKLAAAIVEARKDAANQIPGSHVPGATPTPPEPTMGEQVIGAGEAALSTVTGMTGGAVGMVGGTVKGLADAVTSGQYGTPEGVRTVEKAAAAGAEALTYSPRTAAGQEQTEAIGKGMQQLIPVAPLAGEMAMAGRAASTAARPAADVAQSARAAALQAVRAKVEAAAARRAQAAGEAGSPTPGTMGSVGAAGTDLATIRRVEAQQLPVPVDLTKGQATRSFEQLRFEQEMAKDPLKGQPLRERFADQNQAMLRNFDVWVDETGAQLTDARSVGDSVTGALRQRATADKARIRSAYKEAEKAGEMESPVVLGDAVGYLNESAPDAAVAPVLDAMKARAVRLGIAAMGEDGQLVPQPVPLKTAELWRRSISNATNAEPTNIRHAAQVKGLIDAATETEGGTLYKQARSLRSRFAQNYENIGLVYDLMNTKRGMADARVAAEDVFRRSILNSSFQDMRQLRRILQTGGEDGKQAWRELQGATVRHIRDEATKNVARDTRGSEIVSAAQLHKTLSGLDRSGKLDFMFGKKGAEQMRAINELAKVVYTAPPGVINTSNTASVLLAALDIATSGVAGFPLPVMSGLRILTTHVKDRQIQKRINEALGIKPEPKKVRAPVSVVPKTAPNVSRVPESRTVH